MNPEKAAKLLADEFAQYPHGVDYDDLLAWVAALESGKYEQGHDFLQRDGLFCPLGVYADMHGFETENLRLLSLVENFPRTHVLADPSVTAIITGLNDGSYPSDECPGYIFPAIADILRGAINEANERQKPKI